MKRLLHLSVWALVALTACSKQPASTQQPSPAQSLLTRIDTLQQHGIMYGHQDDPFYGINWMWDRNGRSDTKELVGDYPAVMGFDLGGLEEEGHTANLDSVPFEWMRTEVIRHHERGGIVTFSWHPRNPLTGGTAWDVSDTATVSSILPGGAQHEKFVGWMNKVTTFLSSLKDKDNNPIPFILRPWHEYNGSWFWWGQNICTDEQFVALWNMFQQHVNSKLSNNVVWAFSPNLDGLWTEERFLNRYPGNSCVDLLGCDAYQWGSEEDFAQGLTADLDFLSAFAKQAGKPLAMTECGKKNSTTPDWFSRVFFPIIDHYQLSYFLLWRNWQAEHFGASKDAPTADDFKQMVEAGRFKLVNDIQ